MGRVQRREKAGPIPRLRHRLSQFKSVVISPCNNVFPASFLSFLQKWGGVAELQFSHSSNFSSSSCRSPVHACHNVSRGATCVQDIILQLFININAHQLLPRPMGRFRQVSRNRLLRTVMTSVIRFRPHYSKMPLDAKTAFTLAACLFFRAEFRSRHISLSSPLQSVSVFAACPPFNATPTPASASCIVSKKKKGFPPSFELIYNYRPALLAS